MSSVIKRGYTAPIERAGTPHISMRGAEPHRGALLFYSLHGARYLFDTGTSSLHPWPWPVEGGALDILYESSGEVLAWHAAAGKFPEDLISYVQTWRRHAGAFGKPICGGQRHVAPPAWAGGCSAGEGCTIGGEEGCGTASSQSGSAPEIDSFTGPKGAECIGCAVEPSACASGGGCAKGRPKTPPPLQFHLPSMFGNLMLVVTDGCNLQCAYCMLGGYKGYKPLRAKHMDWETAKAAIDEFVALNNTPAHRAMHNRKINIAFFGGEPLLRGDLLMRAVDYSKKLEKPGCGYWIDYSLTTNLTHLPDELAAFLVSRDVSVQVSIDGPPEVHDRYRVTRNGKGSFDRMYRNLEKLRALDAGYFEKRVRAVITFNGNSDILAMHAFFSSGDPHIPKIAFIGSVRDMEVAEFHRRHPYDPARLYGQYRELMDIYFEQKQTGAPVVHGDFLYHLFEEPLLTLYKRIMSVGMGEKNSYTATCQPGRRIAVATDGRYHVCERINEEFPIGDVQNGLDRAACENLMKRYYAALPDCDSCWANALCISCLAHNCHEGRFHFEERCVHIRAELSFKLQMLCTLLEKVPHPFATDDALIDMVPVAP